jgi:hypothetical protein
LKGTNPTSSVHSGIIRATTPAWVSITNSNFSRLG